MGNLSSQEKLQQKITSNIFTNKNVSLCKTFGTIKLINRILIRTNKDMYIFKKNLLIMNTSWTSWISKYIADTFICNFVRNSYIHQLMNTNRLTLFFDLFFCYSSAAIIILAFTSVVLNASHWIACRSAMKKVSFLWSRFVIIW